MERLKKGSENEVTKVNNEYPAPLYLYSASCHSNVLVTNLQTVDYWFDLPSHLHTVCRDLDRGGTSYKCF